MSARLAWPAWARRSHSPASLRGSAEVAAVDSAGAQDTFALTSAGELVRSIMTKTNAPSVHADPDKRTIWSAAAGGLPVRSRRLSRLLPLASAMAATILATGASGQGRPGATAPPGQIQASPPSPQAGAEPQETSAVYGDWTLRCIRQGEGAQVRRTCEVVQSLRQQGQVQPFAQVALGRPDAGRGWRIVVLLPPNIALPSVVRIGSVEGQPPLVELAWRRCLPNACVADSELPAPVLAKLHTGTETGRLTFQNGAGREITLLFSLRGLPQALDAFAR